MTLSRVKTWVSGENLTADNLNDEFDNILSFLNSSPSFDKVGIGMSPSNILDLTQNQNSASVISLLNNDAGAAAAAKLLLSNGTSGFTISHTGVNFTPSGLTRADGDIISASGAGGLTINTTVGQPIYIGCNNSEVARFTQGYSTGILVLGNLAGTQAGNIGFRRGGDGSMNAFIGWSSATDDTTLQFINNSGAGVLQYVAGISGSHEWKISSTSIATIAGTTFTCKNGVFSTTGADVLRTHGSGDAYASSAVHCISTDAAAGTGFNFLRCVSDWNGTPVVNMFVRGDGNVYNTNNVFGAISDAKLKDNIAPSGSQYDDVKALAAAVSKFTFTDDASSKVQLGLIAQDVLAISPGLVTATADVAVSYEPVLDDKGKPVLLPDGTPQTTRIETPLGTQTLSVAYSLVYLKAVKALGEVMDRLEALEAKVP